MTNQVPFVIPFGEWLPDQPAYGLQGAHQAINVLANGNSYIPFPAINSATENGLGGIAIGAIYAIDINAGTYNYFGDKSALYRLVSNSFSVVTRLAGGAYTTNTIDFWEFVNWGNTLIGVNGLNDLPQQISLGAANFTTLSIGVKARHIAVVKDFVVLGNVNDSAVNLCRVRWSAINNPLSFTADAATLADYQDLPQEGGQIQRLVGGEACLVFQQRAIHRMTFVGSPLVFQFDKVETNIGAYVPQGVMSYQNMVFFLSEDGFYSFDGSALNPIGRGKVDNFFHADLNTSAFHQIVSTIDPINKVAMWAYPSDSSVAGYPDKILAYNWAWNRWTLITGIDIEYFTTTFDNSGNLVPSGFYSGLHTMGRFNGSAMAATVETGEFQLYPDELSTITNVRALVDGKSASATVSLYGRNKLTESVSLSSALAGPFYPNKPNDNGMVDVRCTKRYFRVRVITNIAPSFDHLIGVEVFGVPCGNR